MIDNLKMLISKLTYKLSGDLINNIYLLVKNPGGKEHCKKFGEKNPNKTIYLIRRKQGGYEGLLSVFVYIMGRIDFADRNGMIPFVDDDELKKYFSFRATIELSEVYQSKKVLFSGYDSKPVYPGWCNWINLDFNEQKRALFDKYVTFSSDVNNSVRIACDYVHPEKCVGLYLRGTDYLSLKPGGHPIQPRLRDVMNVLNRFMNEGKYERIFLVTEDQLIFNECIETYGEKIVIIKDDCLINDYRSGEYVIKAVERKKIETDCNLLYLTKIIVLSKCAAFVGGRTNGSSVACALNGGDYRYKYVYDVGYYM